MSSHGYDPPQEKSDSGGGSAKPSGGQHPQPHQLSGLISGTLQQGDLYRQPFQGVPRQTLAARPIAPAPSPVSQRTAIPIVTTHSTVGQRVINVTTTQHQNIIPKVQTVMGNQIEGGHLPQTMAMNLSTQPHANPMLSGSPIVSIAPGIGLPNTHVAGAAVGYPMASLINRSTIQPVLHQSNLQTAISQPGSATLLQATPASLALSQGGQVQGIQVSHPPGAPIIQGASLQTYTPHIPRGAAAASQLTGPKPGAGTVLRSPHPGSVQIPLGAMPITSTTLHTRGVTPLRPGTPPVTVGKSSTHIAQQLEQRSTTMGPAPNTVQITIQQSRPAGDAMNRPIISHLQAQPKQQPIIQHQQLSSGQKVVMSQSTAVNPILQPTSSVAVSITAPRNTGMLSNIALNLSQAYSRPQKLASSQPTALTGNTTSLGPSHGLTFSQGTSRQKIIMTQGMTQGLTQGLTQGDKGPGIPAIVATTGKLGGVVSGPTLQRPKVQVMSSGNVSLAGISAPAITQISIASAAVRPSLPIVSIPGGSAAHSAFSGVPMTTTVASTATSIPIAKVNPQRQVQSAVHSQQGSQEVSRGEAAGVIARAVSVQAPGAAQSQGAGVYLPPGGHRASPSVTSQPATTSHSESRQSSDRSNVNIPNFPYGLPTGFTPDIAAAPFLSYQNLFYQQVAQAAQTAHLSQTSAIRPAAISVPTQNPNLAATLQPHTVSGTGPQGVRLNPSMMVTVDPSGHPTLSVQAQYPQPADTKVASSVAESSGASSIGATSHPAVSAATMSGHPGGPSAVPITQPNASPRPSILRKRAVDGTTVVKKNLLSSMSSAENLSENQAMMAVGSPKPPTLLDPSRENSQSSTDTASSAESTPRSVPPPDIKIKEEPPDTTENGTAASGALALSQLSNNMEASPRKKPRKQLLHATTEQLKDGTSTDEEIEKFSAKVNLKRELEQVAEEVKKEDLEEYVDEEGVRWTKEKKRPPINLMNHYQCTWKTRNNHFQRYSDVKPKEERRPTVNELANQKCVHQKASGWKMYHLAAQLEEIMDQEREVFSKIAGVQDTIAPRNITMKHPTMEDDIGMIHELTQGNKQRSQLMMDQLEEARASMLKILNHKQRIAEIITKHHSKRPVKKKERT